MDKSLILSLALNSECYGDKINPFDNEEYRKNHKELFRICEKLCKNLSEEEKQETLNEISCALCALERFATDEYFKEGFKLGLTLGAQNFLD